MLEKLDLFKKGWKRHTTSAVFAALVTLCATKGIDLTLYVDAVEQVYAGLSVAYAAIMTGLKVISKDG